MQIKLSDEKRAEFTEQLQSMFQSEFDEALSEYRADAIVELFLKSLGPGVYNQAVQEVRAHLQSKLDDLDGEVYADG